MWRDSPSVYFVSPVKCGKFVVSHQIQTQRRWVVKASSKPFFFSSKSFWKERNVIADEMSRDTVVIQTVFGETGGPDRVVLSRSLSVSTLLFVHCAQSLKGRRRRGLLFRSVIVWLLCVVDFSQSTVEQTGSLLLCKSSRKRVNS